MPELPEVATLVRALKPRILGVTIRGVEVRDRQLLVETSPRRLRAALVGAVICGVARWGKVVRLDFEPAERGPGECARTAAGASLFIHLRMTGRYFVMKTGDRARPRVSGALPPATRLVLTADGRNGPLLIGLKDKRRLARIRLAGPAEAHRWPRWLDLGPDALDEPLDGPALADRVWGRLPIKLALLDQSRIAGLGNIYSAEVLHRTRIHPARRACDLTPAEWRALAREIPKLLLHSMRRWCLVCRRIGPGDEGFGRFDGELRVYGRPGQRCRRCGGRIESMVQAGRTTWYCGGCQK